MIVKSRSLFFSVVCFLLATPSCTKLDVFEKNVAIPKNEWNYNFKPSFNFNITDTGSEYNLYVVIRHRDAYRYNNIWLNIGTQSSKDTMRFQRFDLLLGTDAKGWDGTGMDDIWELRKSITNGPFKFNKPGNYIFSIQQIMRENPLLNILSIGIRVEKVK
ncbi:gliding motility lipoprotein GldH [Ferruginibacter lapsinanis]|uniref:gliding motility lipoprotein GldH n=1 Tax=Ferruginibacter lapsinanis TaxID=563172 RepID=UPI001E33E871|nr:gliding motility lipoprotein GldH [Ferruginibacter lapsinanis]UEG51025.1 gliding motility lipoprotein GldH [Ferruginibacter lapsinanis]